MYNRQISFILVIIHTSRAIEVRFPIGIALKQYCSFTGFSNGKNEPRPMTISKGLNLFFIMFHVVKFKKSDTPLWKPNFFIWAKP